MHAAFALLIFAGAPGVENLLDPPGEAWVPLRGARAEVSVFLGGEAALGEVGATGKLPTLGGGAMTLAGRYYPVDRLAISTGLRGYFGLDAPAAGTTAATVLSPFAGVRWDSIRENRFSLLSDFASGPAFFAFQQGPGDGLTWALGMDANAALTARYSLGAATFELRVLLGGRVGEASDIGRPRFDVGPFSALYVGVDTGLTWSFAAPAPRAKASP